MPVPHAVSLWADSGGPLARSAALGPRPRCMSAATGGWSSPTAAQRGQRSVRREVFATRTTWRLSRSRYSGRPHQSTYFTGSAATETSNVLDIGVDSRDAPKPRLIIESISVVSAGARRRATGDYPRVYDTMIGTLPTPVSGETWLCPDSRLTTVTSPVANHCGVRACRSTTDQQMMLRCNGVRARDSDSHRYRGAGTGGRCGGLEVQ